MTQFKQFLDEIAQLDEVLSKDSPASKWIGDFVKSDNPRFAGKSKKQRIKMALGAYYAKHHSEDYTPENFAQLLDEAQLDEISKETLKSYIPKAMGSKEGADFMRGVKMGRETDRKGEDELRAKSLKRSAGIHTAIKKLTRENNMNEEIERKNSTQHPLEGHEYHKKTDAALHYIVKDAHEAEKAMRGHNSTAENKYADQKNDAATVLHFRKSRGGMPDWYAKKYGHKTSVKESLEESSDLEKGHIEQSLADKDINSKVEGNKVHVHKDNVKSTKSILKKLGYHSHTVHSGLNEDVEQIDEAEEWELKRIHGEYKHLKSLTTADVHKKHKSLYRVTSSYKPAEVGGKQGMIDDIMHHRHGQKRMGTYHALTKKQKDSLSEAAEVTPIERSQEFKQKSIWNSKNLKKALEVAKQDDPEKAE